MSGSSNSLFNRRTLTSLITTYLNRDYLLPFILILVLLLGTWWLLRGTRVTRVDIQPAPAHNSDYYISGFTTLALDQDGQRRYRLSARRLVHYIDDDSTELTLPEYSKFNGQKSSLHVNAETGRGTQDNSLIKLQGNVLITSKDQFNNTRLVTETDQLTLYPNRDYAETGSPVTIKNAESITKGVGMTVDSREGKLVLLSKVNSIYYPQGRTDQ